MTSSGDATYQSDSIGMSKTVRRRLLQQVLSEWSAKLGIDGSSLVLTSDAGTEETLLQWIRNEHRDSPHSISAMTDSSSQHEGSCLGTRTSSSVATPIPDAHFSHVFLHIDTVSKQLALKTLKKAFYALAYKGIAVVTCAKRDPVADVLATVLASEQKSIAQSEILDLADLAEEAQFERGKIRCMQQNVSIASDELAELVQNAKKALETQVGPCADDVGWRLTFAHALGEEQRKGGISIECWLLIAMKWDMLCA